MGHRIFTEAVHPNGLTAFVAYCFIYNYPFGQAAWCLSYWHREGSSLIVSKAVLRFVDLDVWKACIWYPVSICTSYETAVHAVRQLFPDPGSKPVQSFGGCFRRI